MPKRNAVRTIGAERALVSRIEKERVARGWSYERLAKEMTQVGCPINPVSLWRINGDPPRQITVDEAVALSRIWAIPLDRLIDNKEL